jgi:hypothetical protein
VRRYQDDFAFCQNTFKQSDDVGDVEASKERVKRKLEQFVAVMALLDTGVLASLHLITYVANNRETVEWRPGTTDLEIVNRNVDRQLSGRRTRNLLHEIDDISTRRHIDSSEQA